MTVATDGAKAIATLNTYYFDLVITDLLMPETDGFQVLKATKQKDAQTMVIILTGGAELESAIDALRLGADDFLQKPCSTGELLYRMSNCFAKQDLQRNAALYEKILPVCSYCKKIRVNRPGEPGNGPWYSVEEYFNKAKGMQVFHGCCPDCFTAQIREVHLEKSKQLKSPHQEGTPPSGDDQY